MFYIHMVSVYIWALSGHCCATPLRSHSICCRRLDPRADQLQNYCDLHSHLHYDIKWSVLSYQLVQRKMWNFSQLASTPSNTHVHTFTTTAPSLALFTPPINLFLSSLQLEPIFLSVSAHFIWSRHNFDQSETTGCGATMQCNYWVNKSHSMFS